MRRLCAGISRSAGIGFCLAAFTATAASAAPIHVTGPWFRYLLPSLPAGGYMRLENASDRAVRLTGARSPACGSMMLHKTVHQNGVEKMVAVHGVTIPPHGRFVFEPGFYHVMCMQPKMKPGEKVAVTLRFAHAPSVTVPFAVYGATGRPRRK